MKINEKRMKISDFGKSIEKLYSQESLVVD